MDEKRVNRLSSKEAKSEVLSWDWERDVAQTVKLQIELLSNHIIKSVENKEERRNGYLLILKYLFYYTENSGIQDILKMELDQEKDFVAFLKSQTGKSNIML